MCNEAAKSETLSLQKELSQEESGSDMPSIAQYVKICKGLSEITPYLLHYSLCHSKHRYRIFFYLFDAWLLVISSELCPIISLPFFIILSFVRFYGKSILYYSGFALCISFILFVRIYCRLCLACIFVNFICLY